MFKCFLHLHLHLHRIKIGSVQTRNVCVSVWVGSRAHFGQTDRLIEFWLNNRFTYHCFVYLLHSFHWKCLRHVVIALHWSTFALISVPLVVRDVVDICFVCFQHRCQHCCHNHNTALRWPCCTSQTQQQRKNL